MGSMTDANIAAWQKHAGLTPASDARVGALMQLQSLAFDLIKICELEKSGIRGGDGYWYGCDPLGELTREIGAFAMLPVVERDEEMLPF